jgi:hypothetical protein
MSTELDELAEAIARDDRREEMKAKSDICGYCPHPRKKHCTAFTNHVPYKEEMRMQSGHVEAHPYPCVSNHCEVALCDCREFQESL